MSSGNYNFSSEPQPRTIAPSREDVLSNLMYFFGAPVSPEKLKDYSEHHAMTCALAPAAPRAVATGSATHAFRVHVGAALLCLAPTFRPLPRCAPPASPFSCDATLYPQRSRFRDPVCVGRPMPDPTPRVRRRPPPPPQAQPSAPLPLTRVCFPVCVCNRDQSATR